MGSIIFNSIKMRMHSGLFLMIILFSFASAANEIDKVSTIIKRLDTKFAAMASNKKIGTMSLDSMNLFFRTVVVKFPAIQSLMRINSNGVVINEISSLDTNNRMRNVADQKWFIYAKTTRLPYYGVNRDLTGSSSFFWAWPILSADSQFNGAISVKINPSKLLEMASVDNESHILILFNESTIYKRNYIPSISFRSDTILLAKQTSIIIKYANANVVNSDSNDTRVIQSSVDQSTIIKATPVNNSKPVKEVSAPAKTDLSQSTSAPPPVYKTNLLNNKTPKRNNFLFVICALSIILLIIFITFVIFKKVINTQTQYALPLSDNSPGNQNNIICKEGNDIATDEIKPIADADAKLIDSINKSIPNDMGFGSKPDNLKINEANKTEIDENNEMFNKTEQSTLSEQFNQKTDTEKMLEQKIRKYVYREIHNQIMQWVVCESARLNGRIEELNRRLTQNENGSTEELEEIKHEAEDISKQIDLFRLHLTNNNDQ